MIRRFVFFLLGICMFCFFGCEKIEEGESKEPLPSSTMTMESCSIDAVISYQDLLKEYEDLLEHRFSSEFWESDFFDLEKYPALKIVVGNATEEKQGDFYLMVGEMSLGTIYTSKEKFTSEILDLNKDGSDEMLWLNPDQEILAVFQMIDETPVLFGAFRSRYQCIVTEDGNLTTIASGGAGITHYTVYRLLKEPLQAEIISEFGKDRYLQPDVYYEAVGEETVAIDETRFEELIKQHVNP